MNAQRQPGLTTHVLDTSRGCPAVGLRIDLSRVDADGRTCLIKTVTTDADGRSDAPLLGPEEMRIGRYELLFHVGVYFRATGSAPTDPPSSARCLSDSRSPSLWRTITSRCWSRRTAT